MYGYKITLNNRSISGMPKLDAASLISDGVNLHLHNGWNPASEHPDFTPVSNTHYISTDDGITWTKLSNAPYAKRDSSGAFYANGKNYIVAGNIDGSAAIDVWSWSQSSGWELVTSDWGLGLKLYANFCY